MNFRKTARKRYNDVISLVCIADGITVRSYRVYLKIPFDGNEFILFVTEILVNDPTAQSRNFTRVNEGTDANAPLRLQNFLKPDGLQTAHSERNEERHVNERCISDQLDG